MAQLVSLEQPLLIWNVYRLLISVNRLRGQGEKYVFSWPLSHSVFTTSPWGLYQLSLFTFCLGIFTFLPCLLLQLWCSSCRTWYGNLAGSWWGNSAGAYLTSTVWRVTSFWITQHKADAFWPVWLCLFPVPITGFQKYMPPLAAFGDLRTNCPRVECFYFGCSLFLPKKA